MKSDDSFPEPDLRPHIDPALEARVVAGVLGEASAFEADELRRLGEENPELALFERRIQSAHNLVSEAARPDAQPLRLDPGRRAKLLATIGDHPARSENHEVLVAPTRRRPSRGFTWLVRTYGLAASILVVIGAYLLFAPTGNSVRETARRPSPRSTEPAREREASATLEAQAKAIEESERRKAQRVVGEEREAAAGSRYRRSEADAADGFALRLAPAPEDPRSLGTITLPSNRSAAPSGGTSYFAVPRLAERQTSGGNTDELEEWADETVVEAPFEVTTEAEVGYTATSTLAGNRLNTQLRDIGSSVTVAGQDYRAGAPPPSSPGFREYTGTADENKAAQGSVTVLTSQFLRDTGAVSNETLLQYTTNTEASGTQGNFAGLSDRDPNSLRFGQGNPTGVISNETEKDKRQYGSLRWKSELYSWQPAPSSSAEISNISLAQPFILSQGPAGESQGGETGVRPGQPIRGLAAADNTRDYFPSDIPWNGYGRFAPFGNEETGDLTALEAAVGYKQDDSLTTEYDARVNPAQLAKVLQEVRKREAAKVEAAVEKTVTSPPPPPPVSLEETTTAVEAVSTFSLHVSDVSFRLAQAALARGEAPDPARIRPEEFYNAFDYGDPAPAATEKIACRIEQGAHPFIPQRNLVRIAMRVPATGRGAGQPLRLTVLLDTSGSMEREDRVASVQRALEVLATLLGPSDRVTLIGFARQPRLLAEALPGDQAVRLAQLAAQTPSEGGTNLEAALQLAITQAQSSRDTAAQNRIVLLTDGAANLGNADPEKIGAMIEAARQQGLAFDACGVGTDGLDDAILEALTRKGDGRYYVLDSPADADAGFARQLAGAFRPAAQNVKLQVRFNPARVTHYRLLGFEQHRLRNEDFRNDRVDAAELAAEEAAVAVYQVEVNPEGAGELGDVFVRFRDTASGQMVERSWTMPFDARTRAFDRATPTLQLAGVAALLAEKLRGGAAGDLVQLDELAPVVNALRRPYAGNARVQELVTMFEQARRLVGE